MTGEDRYSNPILQPDKYKMKNDSYSSIVIPYPPKEDTEKLGYSIELLQQHQKAIYELLAGMEIPQLMHISEVLDQLTKMRNRTARRIFLTSMKLGFAYPSLVAKLFPREDRTNVSRKLKYLSSIGIMERINYKDLSNEVMQNFRYIILYLKRMARVIPIEMANKPTLYIIRSEYLSLVAKTILANKYEKKILNNWKAEYVKH